MKGLIGLCALIVVGGLSPVATGYQDQPQAPRAVRMRTLRPGDTLYVLLGGGGNALALMRDEGVVLIDTKLPGWGGPILEAITAVSDKPVTMIINTHSHLDHTGGSLEFPTVTEIVAHANTKANMQKMDAFHGSNARFLPNRTVTDKVSLLDGLDRIDLYYFGAGHTNGDLVVVFPAKHLAYFGDLFPSKATPFIDTTNGGSGVAFPHTLAKAIGEITGVDRVITGHEEGVAAQRNPTSTSVDISTPRTMTWTDLREYADFNRDFLAAVQASIAAGKTAAAAAATLRLPERYKDYDMQRAKANVETIYGELQK